MVVRVERVKGEVWEGLGDEQADINMKGSLES